MNMNLEGKMLGNRYEIIEKIGNGGMATVYKAKCHVLNRYVAVKVLRDEFTTDEEFIKRFAAEAQSAASLTHPNIVSIYDVGHEDNLYYIVMELIKGKTLKQIINEDGKLPWKWSLNIVSQIASALDGIKGIGEKRKTALLKEFKSVARIKQATIEELAAVIGEAAAKSVKEAL